MSVREGTGVKTKQKQDTKLKKPDMYKVLLLNDHYTTMEFVVHILRTVFHKQTMEATRIMLDAHKKGKGVVGTYPYDIAVTKQVRVLRMAREAEYPLECVIEKE